MIRYTSSLVLEIQTVPSRYIFSEDRPVLGKTISRDTRPADYPGFLSPSILSKGAKVVRNPLISPHRLYQKDTQLPG